MSVEFDKMCVKYYANKLHSCASRNVEFNLTFTQVKNMLRAKKCQYTGVALTKSTGASQRCTDVTIERIDPSLPYESGNVCAVSFAANQAKAKFDEVFRGQSALMFMRVSKRIAKQIKEKSK